MSRLMNLIMELGASGSTTVPFAPSPHAQYSYYCHHINPKGNMVVLAPYIWKNSIYLEGWKSVKWILMSLFCSVLILLAFFTGESSFCHLLAIQYFLAAFGAIQMKSFFEIPSSEKKKKNHFHDFNVSQSLPRSLWTTGFVVLCLIFFLCKTGMDSRFQPRLLFQCFQGLFLRSHMGYCDECTRQGMFSEHTSN